MTMNVSAVLIALVVGLIGVHTSNASSQSFTLSNSLAIGDHAIVKYTAPPTGRVSVNLWDEGNADILLHVDYRVDYSGDQNTILLNTRTGSKWGTNVRIRDIITTPGTFVIIEIIAQEDSFRISFNKKRVATYPYRINKPVTTIEYQNYDYQSFLRVITLYCNRNTSSSNVDKQYSIFME